MAKRKFGEESRALYRVEKFEIRPTQEQLAIILAVSESLRLLFNAALSERQEAFNTLLAPLYMELKSALGTTEAVEIRSRIKQAYKRLPTLFDQINGLTAKRRSDAEFGSQTRNWQEETLDMLDGAYKSFVALRMKNDPDARPPRERREGWFQKIPGRSGFKIIGDQLQLSCLGGERKLLFTIPRYQQKRLAKAAALKKFELYRDEKRLDLPGRFWISVAYELVRPEATFFDPEKAVYLAIGSSSIGVVSPWTGSIQEVLGTPSGQSEEGEIIPLWRSDKHWLPLIEQAEAEMAKLAKGTLRWRRFEASRKEMHRISAAQRLQDEREVIQYLLRRHGHHFVVKDVVVRSKKGKLADSTKPERGGPLGLNWAAQNTGSLARLVMLLEDKVKEFKGSVRRHKLVLDQYPPGKGHLNKRWMARKLRESFLEGQASVVV